MSHHPDIDAAFESVHKCLVLAGSLALCVSETQRELDAESPSDELIREMHGGAMAWITDLAGEIPRAETALAPLAVEYSALHDDPAYSGAKSYASFHEAAFNAANNLFVEVCSRLRSLRWTDSAVASSQDDWQDACRRLSWTRVPLEIDDTLHTMIRKEAAKLATMRDRTSTVLDQAQADQMPQDAETPEGAGRQTEAQTDINEDAYLSSSRLAELFAVQHNSLRKKLDRWRQKNAAGSGWMETTERKPNEPRYLYKVGAVRTIIDELREATSQTTSERPAKKS